MKAIDLLTTRRSVVARSMIEPGPSPTELETILRAGIRVPDHGKLFPWRLQVVLPAAQTKLGDYCAEVFRVDNPDAPDEQVATERLRPTHAPVLVVVSNRIVKNHKIPEFEQYLSGGAVCQNLLNAAHAMGYVGQWLTEWPSQDPRIARHLGQPPDAETVGWIYIGSCKEPPSERVRATLDDVVTYWEGPGNEVSP